MHISSVNKGLRYLISASIAANVAMLVIDYFTRDNADSSLSSVADVLTVTVVLSLTITLPAILGIIVKARGKLSVIEQSTWMLLAVWTLVLLVTLPVENWIAG